MGHAVLDSVERWVRGIASEMRLAQGSVSRYTKIARDHATACVARGASSWSEVSADDIREDMARGEVGRATARLRLTVIKKLHAWLLEHGMTEENVAVRVRNPKIGIQTPHVLTREEVLALIGACAGSDPFALRDRALIEVAYSTGARASELATIELRDIDLERGTAILHGKGDKSRFAVLGPSAVAAVRRYLEVGRAQLDGDPGETHLFLSNRHAMLSGMGLWRIIERRAREAGIERHVHPHMLRHAFAAHMVQQGADLRTIQLLLGHANVATVQIYLQFDDRWLREAHRRYHPRGDRKA